MMSTWSPGSRRGPRARHQLIDRAREPALARRATPPPRPRPSRDPAARTSTPRPRRRATAPSVSRCTPMRIVAERGSSTATMRLPPTLRRNPSMRRRRWRSGDARNRRTRRCRAPRRAAPCGASTPLNSASAAMAARPERRRGARRRSPPARSRRCARPARTTSRCPAACRLRAPRTSKVAARPRMSSDQAASPPGGAREALARRPRAHARASPRDSRRAAFQRMRPMPGTVRTR